MLRKILVSSKKNAVIFNVIIKFSSNEDNIRLTNLFMKSNKFGFQESGEIINMSNDSNTVNIPRSNDFRSSGNFLKSDLVNASLNERATLDLSSNMYANTPEPPNEAENYNDRPYNSIMSLGACDERNDKYISVELMGAQNLSESQCPRELSHEHMMVSLYLLNEKRFGIRFVDDALDRIACGELDIVLALEYQNNIMKEVDKYWRKSSNELDDELHLFILYPSENNENVRGIIKLFRTLNIPNKEELISRFNLGQLPLLSLTDKIDQEVRIIVSQWRTLQNQC